jgi:hypothetical protein
LNLPVDIRTVEEATAFLESQVQGVEEMQAALSQQEVLLTECQRRHTREEGQIRELESDIQTLTRQLQIHTEEAQAKDQSLKELFDFYTGYSQLIQDVFGIQLELVVPPVRLLPECSAMLQATFQEARLRPVSFYFSSVGALVQVKVL